MQRMRVIAEAAGFSPLLFEGVGRYAGTPMLVDRGRLGRIQRILNFVTLSPGAGLTPLLMLVCAH